MVSVRESPNMMSAIGLMPVIAAPTATPVKPASEMGVSMTRLLPNSSTRPERTLKGVPASATSSPRIMTRESRRISSASASRMASANVIVRSRVSGIDVTPHVLGCRIGRIESELGGLLDLRADLRADLLERRGRRETVRREPVGEPRNGIAARHPVLFLLLQTVVGTVDISDVMTVVPVCVAQQERGPLPCPGPRDQRRRRRVHGAHVLAVDALGANT